MVSVDDYTSVGYALELLAQSDYHRQFELGDYFSMEILPPISCNQVRFYLTPEGWPTAMVTWAWLSEEVEKDVLCTGRALESNEWKCGDKLFCNDWITPYKNLREVVYDISHNVFPDQVATSVRRYSDGSVRSINRWTGVNLRRKRKGVSAFSPQQ